MHLWRFLEYQVLYAVVFVMVFRNSQLKLWRNQDEQKKTILIASTNMFFVIVLNTALSYDYVIFSEKKDKTNTCRIYPDNTVVGNTKYHIQQCEIICLLRILIIIGLCIIFLTVTLW